VKTALLFNFSVLFPSRFSQPFRLVQGALLCVRPTYSERVLQEAFVPSDDDHKSPTIQYDNNNINNTHYNMITITIKAIIINTYTQQLTPKYVKATDLNTHDTHTYKHNVIILYMTCTIKLPCICAAVYSIIPLA